MAPSNFETTFESQMVLWLVMLVANIEITTWNQRTLSDLTQEDNNLWDPVINISN
jgi:hypothetical protein